MNRFWVLFGSAVLVLMTACSSGGKATAGSLPASCSKSPFPVLEGAQKCESDGTLTSFTVNSDIATVHAFYIDYFKKDGWIREDNAALPDVSTWGKNRNKGTVALTQAGRVTTVNLGLIKFDT